ncbi:hypothetical protein [Legionella lansingensis]|nr:hypothetical protein [Legionella lansingensis]
MTFEEKQKIISLLQSKLDKLRGVDAGDHPSEIMELEGTDNEEVLEIPEMLEFESEWIKAFSSEIEKLLSLLKEDQLELFEEAFKSSCENHDDDISLYWQIAEIAFKPKTMEDMAKILFPNMDSATIDERINDLLHEAIDNPQMLQTILSLLPEDKRLPAVLKEKEFVTYKLEEEFGTYEGSTLEEEFVAYEGSTLYLSATKPQALRTILQCLPETKNLTEVEHVAVINLLSQINELREYEQNNRGPQGDAAYRLANELIHLTTQFIIGDYETKKGIENDFKATISNFKAEEEDLQEILNNIESKFIEFQGVSSSSFKAAKIKKYEEECTIQINRLENYDNPVAKEKRTILEQARGKLQEADVDPGQKLNNFYAHIRDNQNTLVEPHSSLPKDIIKGLITFIGYILGVYPGVQLKQRLFGENRPTTTGEKIVEPVLRDINPKG